MRIGELAIKAGVTSQTLRYYERRGLIACARRTSRGFREYDDHALRKMRFIQKAQALGFTLDEIRDLLGLWDESNSACRAVEKRASATLERIERKVSDLRRMSDALNTYVSACRMHSTLQRCPLLEVLGEDRHD